MKRLLALFLFLITMLNAAAQESVADSIALRLSDAGFFNVRSIETEKFRVFTIENDLYKIKPEGIARAVDIVEGAGLPDTKPVKIIVTDYNVPQLTVSYVPQIGHWLVTDRLDASWDAVRSRKKLNNSFGKVDILLYPQVSLKNLIINQVYQSLWQISPSLEVSLWPGAKLAYMLKIPIYNDGYGSYESYVHPGNMTLSQRFRDPWHLNITGKFTVGTFANARFGAALEMKYVFPNERFWVDTQLAYLGIYYFSGFTFHYDRYSNYFWNVAGNYYWPKYQTQFTLRAQRFLMCDYGVKFEMIRHFRHCSIGFYALKGEGPTNGGFRFQVALPPYRMKRHGYWPRITTSGQMGLVYNANNEQSYYREFKTEASDNIMSNNSFNTYYVQREIDKNR